MTEKKSSEARDNHPFLALVAALNGALVLVVAADPFPAFRVPLLIGIGAVLVVCAFYLGVGTKRTPR